MLSTKQMRMIGAATVVVALGANGLAYQKTTKVGDGKTAKVGADRSPDEVEKLRREVKLLQDKLKDVQQKLRVREVELQAVRARGADDAKKRAGAEATLGPPRVAEAELVVLRLQQAEYQRRYLTMVEQGRRVPGSIPKDELFAIRLHRDQSAHQVKLKEAEVAQAWLAQRARGVEIALMLVQNADDKESRQEAIEVVEKAMQKLREEVKKQDNPKNKP